MLEPSHETAVPRYLKLVTMPNFCSFTFISLWMPFALFLFPKQFKYLDQSYQTDLHFRDCLT